MAHRVLRMSAIGCVLLAAATGCTSSSSAEKPADACSTIASGHVASALGEPVGDASRPTPEAGAPAGIGGCTFTGADGSRVVVWYMNHGGDEMYQQQKSAPEAIHVALSLPDADAFSAIVGHAQTVFLLSRGRYLNVVVDRPAASTTTSIAESIARQALVTIG